MQVELARGLDAGRHVGEAEVDGLVLDERLAHAAALLCVRERRIERSARHAGRLGGDVDASRLEIRQRDAVAHAFFGEQVLRRYLAVLEHDLCGVGGALAGLVFDARHDVAGCLGRH